MQKQLDKLHYDIIPLRPEAHLFQVALTITQPDPQGQIIWLPAWIPGSYMIRDFAKNIVSLNATSKQSRVSVQKIDKQSWLCSPCAGPLVVTYTIYAWDMSVRTAHLDTTHAFFNGSSIFLAVKGQEHLPHTVDIRLPEGRNYSTWRVATTLPRINTELFSPGTYQSENYEELIDHPVEIGNFIETNFDVENIPHHIVITGQQRGDLERLTSDIKKICRTHVKMFGELPEMERYMFLLTVVGNGYGGLEHRSSSALLCNRTDLPTKNLKQPSDDYINLLGLFSHEYFHTWNVKRIKPASFIPYELTQESYTRLLWAFEGITSYYDELGLIRSQIIEENNYLELLGKNITRVLRTSGRHKQTLVDSSFDAWSKFYKQDENAPNAIVSYYVKGGLFAMALDLKLRELTEHQKSLDDVMRSLWNNFGKQSIGIEENTIRDICNEISGQDMNDFFKTYLSTTCDIPLSSMLASMGIDLVSRPTLSYDDMGGKPANDKDTLAFNLGARFIPDPLGAKIQFIYDEGCLQSAGLAVGDIIIAIDGIQATKEKISRLLDSYAVNDSVKFTIFRGDVLREFEVMLGKAPENTYFLEITEQESLMRNKWLYEVC